MEKDLDTEHRLTAVEGLVSSNSRRLDEVEKRQQDLSELASSVSTIASNQQHMDNDIKEIKGDVKEISARPGRKWDKIIDAGLGILVGTFITWLITGA